MGLDLHLITNLILGIVCLAMGAMLLTIPVPEKEGLKKYAISLKVVSVSYFIMSLLTLSVLIFQLSDGAHEHFAFITISISSFQAYLFTFALITLLDPKYITLKSLLCHFLPFILLAVFYGLFYALFGDPIITRLNEVAENLNNPTLWVRLIFYAYYIFQLIYYTKLFLSEEKKSRLEMMDYFSEEVWVKLSWVRVAFFSALTIGIIVMLSYLLPQKYDSAFTILYALFYFGFAIEYVKYNKIYNIVEPVLKEEVFEPEVIVVNSNSRIKKDWKPLKDKILKQQYYLEAGINIEIIAKRLGVGRTVLSTLINREEGLNFNKWINKLRIEKSKDIILKNPNDSFSVIAEKVGYTEHANFSRQFKNITGESPLLWKKNNMRI